MKGGPPSTSGNQAGPSCRNRFLMTVTLTLYYSLTLGNKAAIICMKLEIDFKQEHGNQGHSFKQHSYLMTHRRKIPYVSVP